jgi:cell division protein FtsA
MELCQIIEARCRETLELVRNEMQASGHVMLPAGIALTGGASQLAGLAELGREVLEMPVRIAGPTGVGGLVDNLMTPAYSTAIGLLRWGAAVTMSGEPIRYDSTPAGGLFGRIRDALRNLFP